MTTPIIKHGVPDHTRYVPIHHQPRIWKLAAWIAAPFIVAVPIIVCGFMAVTA